MPILVVLAAAVVAYFATLALVRHAARLQLVQSPNARSSHVRPTPTGGGLGILAGTTLSGLFAASAGGGPYWIILAAACACALLGLADDRYDVPPLARLVTQATIVVALCAALWAPPPGLFHPAVPGIVLVALCVLAGLWWINLFNFMDGLDGFAASQAMFVLAGAVLLVALGDRSAPLPPYWWWMAGTIAATGGFLILNFPPARIFMGDVGSNHLATLILAFALVSVSDGSLGIWTWGILIAAFSVDATVTLFRRALRRQHLFQGHREHCYQRLSRRWGSHLPVTLSLTGINLVWLLPMATLAQFYPGSGLALCIAAHAPLAVVAWLLGAGRPEASTPA